MSEAQTIAIPAAPVAALVKAYNATAADFDGCEADCEQAKEDAEHAVIEAALAAFGEAT